MLRLNEQYQAVLHPGIMKYSDQAFSAGLTMAYSMFRRTFSNIIRDEAIKIDDLPREAVTDGVISGVARPNSRVRHTYGIDGDPGAVAPLDGRYRACDAGQ